MTAFLVVTPTRTMKCYHALREAFVQPIRCLLVRAHPIGYHHQSPIAFEGSCLPSTHAPHVLKLCATAQIYSRAVRAG